MPQFPAVISLADLDGSNGFRLADIDAGDYCGFSVSAAGDVNGDGFGDILVGAPQFNAGPGATYVVFGKASGFAAAFDLSTLNGSNGFRLDGIDPGDQSGSSVSAAGDVNGDGFGDILVGAFAAHGGDRTGETYVVFGKASGFSAAFDLSTLDGSNGFRLIGIDVRDRSGASVSAAGDVNGDGFGDILVGAPLAAVGDGNARTGETYVVFGRASGFSADLDLSALNGSNGFRLDGIKKVDLSGVSVSAAGDVNGDGFGDILVGAPNADPGGDASAGETYVVFGRASGFSATLKLSALNGSNGFRLNGIDAGDRSGFSVSAAGDVNGDGLGDILVGAPQENHGPGATFVVFGKASGFDAAVDLSALDGTNGFRLEGTDYEDRAGHSVSAAGDVNGDGFGDILVGAYFADPGGNLYAGETYVVFGKASGFDATLNLSALDGSNGFRIDGIEAGDRSGISVSAAGDVNGDGIDDILVGAPGSYPGRDGGEAYVIFGRASTGAHDDDFAIAENGSVNGDLFANNGHGIDNVDPGDTLAITRVNGSAANVGVEIALASGALITVEADGSFSYDTSGVFDDLPAPASGASNSIVNDTFTYRLADGSTATVTVTVSGLDTNDRLEGTNEADTLLAGIGDDRVLGSAGNDTVEGGNGSDTLFGGEDADTLSYAGSANRVIIDLAAGTAKGGDASGDTFNGFENVTGSGLNDILRGDSTANRFDGGNGVDSLSYAASAAGVTVNLKPNTTAGGDAEGDSILNIEKVIGSGFHDILRGDDNANRLTGGAGKDRLLGNLGNDVFDFNRLSDSGLEGTERDRITDFTVNPSATAAFVDRIDLSDIDAEAGTAGNQGFVFIGDEALTAEGQIRVVQHKADTLVYVNTAGNKGAEMILVLENFTAVNLTEADFVL